MLSIEIDLTFNSPVHIGAIAPAGTSAMRGMIKDRDGWPYIPASAFKGRLRHAVERLARSLNYTVCETHRQMCREASTACPACQIFGSPWIKGSVHFVDLQLSAPETLAEMRKKRIPGERPQPEQRFGVGISRARKVSADHLLYTTELFMPGVPITFQGTLKGEITIKQAAWVVAGVRFLDSLGGSRTRGLGWVEGHATVRDDQTQEALSFETLRQALEGKS